MKMKNKIKSRSKSGKNKTNNTSVLKLLPIIIFTSVIIFLIRLRIYQNPLKEFWWNQQGDQIVDFFSYYKMWAIIITASLSLCILLILYFQKSLLIKPSAIYIPMMIYSSFVIISYVFSDYKKFALLGWEDRFEGTLVLLAYMVMLFYIINTINDERDVKVVIYSILTACCILGLLGLTQGIGHDLFATIFGKKLIIPSEYWQYLDKVSFKFKNNEIYQTVYNINYVSFYLTLIIPLTGVLFLTSDKMKSKGIYALLFTLFVYNMFGAASSGGLFGIAAACLVAVLIFGKKLIKYKKEIVILVTIVTCIGIINVNKLAPELNNTVKSVFGKTSHQAHENDNDNDNDKKKNVSETEKKPSMEFIITNKDSVIMSINGDVIKFQITHKNNAVSDKSLKIFDGKDKPIVIKTLPRESGHMYAVNDNRFDFCTIDFVGENDDQYMLINLPGMSWPFLLRDQGILYRTSYGSLVDLDKVETLGFKGNGGIGSGRGYIWSRSLPLIKDTLLWGNGADTFAAYFPQDDFAGKYTGPSFSRNINSVIRKPHSFYLGTAINTGVISLIALLSIFIIYILQSFKLYRRENFVSFNSRAGAGIYLGVCGFLVDAMVYDSNVCVMPLFYGLLGTGIAINLNLTKSVQQKD